jgi:glycosyltransferase involved in cell wall biosynthesis
LSKSSALTAESQYTVRCIAQNYNSAVAGKIQVIPGWVDMSIFKPLIQDKVDVVRQHLGWPLDSPIFFVLRRLEARMGLDNLLRALVIVKKRGFHPYTVIGGSGSLRVSLEKLRDELGLHECVRFMGFVPANMLPQAYAACDASIIPTAQLECFGIIALEALACGKTTLVTPVGALPEVMRNFQPEWIAHDATAEGIADLMCAFLNKSLPPFSYRDVQDVIEKKYSFECALTAYERLFSE